LPEPLPVQISHALASPTTRCPSVETSSRVGGLPPSVDKPLQRRRAGSAARRQCRPYGRWSPRPPNRTCDFHRIRLSMSTTSDRAPARLTTDMEYPLRSGNGAPVFTGDLLPSNRAACPLDPFALGTVLPPCPVGRDSHDYYGSSATPRRQRRTVRLPQTQGSGGHRRGASHVHSSTGRQGRRPAVPRGHRRAPPQHGARPHPSEREPDGQDGPHRERGPSVPTAHSRQFLAGDESRGFNHWYRFPYAFLPC
jgi:hypothetical protein